MSTGYWGIPGGPSHKITKVHYTLDGRYPKPLCGSKLSPLMHFQRCAAGFEDRYVECARCRRMCATAPLIKAPTVSQRGRG